MSTPNPPAEAELQGQEIAIVGMAGRFPGAENIEQFWQNLRDGVESIRDLSDRELRREGVSDAELRDPHYVKRAAVYDHVESFDAGFFGFSPKEAKIMDPQHRHFLEVAWEALENAGHLPEKFPGAIGVFGGSGPNMYMPFNLLTNPDLMEREGFFLVRHTGNDKDFLTTRASYCLNLLGPSVNVQTACSTSLVAVHLAVQSLLSGECDMALAGAITIELPHRRGYHYKEGEVLSPDGRCRAFDAASKGTVFGSGVGIVALRRLSDALEDGDHIHAVIRGTAINNDGAQKVGYLAPSVDGQAQAIAEAIAVANVDVDSISYVETHGTGTPVGDPIEITALTQAFAEGTDKKGFCGVGSVKTNIGHLDTAAGIASVIKVTQALQNKALPPTLHFQSPNPACDFENSPFYVNSTLKEWNPEGPRRAGISSLGVGGTNAHIILEEAPAQEPRPQPEPDTWQLLLTSGREAETRAAQNERLAEHLHQHPTTRLDDTAYTLRHARRAFEYRSAVVAKTHCDAVQALRQEKHPHRANGQNKETEPQPVVFMFPGGGAQYPKMCRDLYASEKVFREAMDQCFAALPPLDVDLKALIFSDESSSEELQKPSRALPALLSIEYALAQQWFAWGLEPAAMTGHSMGEYMAACLAGVMSLEDALALVTLRGQLFETLPEGGMLSVPVSENVLLEHLGENLDIAALNAPDLSVASGPKEELQALSERLEAAGIESRSVKINVAAHSEMLEGILEPFRRKVQQIRLNPPQRPFISNVTGDWAGEEVCEPEYWVRHLRHTVRFSDGIRTLENAGYRIFLEVGPGRTLSSLTQAHGIQGLAAIQSVRHPREDVDDVPFLLRALGQTWCAGGDIDWDTFDAASAARKTQLPSYPFLRTRYWVEPGTGVQTEQDAAAQATALEAVGDMRQWFHTVAWQKQALAKNPDVFPKRWLLLSEPDSSVAAWGSALEARGCTVTRVRFGKHLVLDDQDGDGLSIRANQADDFVALCEHLQHSGGLPERIVYGYGLGAPANDADAMLDQGFGACLRLIQALGAAEPEHHIGFNVLTDGLQSVDGEAVRWPEKATLLGPVRVLGQEFPGFAACAIDVPIDAELGEGSWRDHLIEACAQMAPSGEHVVAFRDGQRYVETIAPQEVAEDAEALTLRQGGTYLFTGGLGGIGSSIAAWLAERTQGHFIMLNRSALPAREVWEEYLSTCSPGDAVGERMRAVLQIEAAGGQVALHQVDVTDPTALKTCVAEIRSKHGSIAGVVHAAGVLNDGLIQLKSMDDARRVLAPKLDGTLALDAVLAEEELDFFVAFASTSTLVAPQGQVDYVAANAFLNAFALSRQGQRPWKTITALNWGIWRDVGMAAAAAQDDNVEGGRGVPCAHPLLGERRPNGTDGSVVFQKTFSCNDWILEEHRFGTGEALIPGTGYLEMARAAVVEVLGQDTAVALRDVTFQAALHVPDEIRRNVRVQLTPQTDAYDVRVLSQQADGQWTEHVRMKAQRTEAATPEARTAATSDYPHHVQAWEAGAQETQQERFLRFGPRWKNVRWMGFSASEGLAKLEMQPAYADETGAFGAHPALLDLATGFGLPLVEGYLERDDFYVPLSYGSITFLRPLGPEALSFIRLSSSLQHRDAVAFDVDICTPDGQAAIEVRNFVVKRVLPDGISAALQQARRSELEKASQSDASLLNIGMRAGISAVEGSDAFGRVLATDNASLVYVSSLPLAQLLDRSYEAMEALQAASEGSGEARESSQAYIEPRDAIEKSLSTLWAETLGVERVGIRDDFFELGGHSLIAVRLFGRIKKEHSVELSLATLFTAPTVEGCASIIRQELGIAFKPEAKADEAGDDAAEAGDESAEAPKDSWTPLVTIQKGKEGVVPFFCVHGAGGNVLNFRDLSIALGTDQPFYGLQARGVDGRGTPVRRVEEMARLYAHAVLEAWPEGPYILGGYSGGGVVAYEMAQQLEAMGKEVDLVVFLDTFSPKNPPRHYSVLERLQNLLKRGPSGIAERLRYKKDLAQKRRAIADHEARNEPPPMDLRELQMTDVFLQAASGYELKPYEGRIALFRAEKIAQAYDHVGYDLGWQKWAKRGMEIFNVPGDHDSLVLEPNVHRLAGELRQCLQRFNRASSSN